MRAKAVHSTGYHWQRNGTNLVENGRYSGVTRATLHIASVTPDDAGSYTVIAEHPTDPVSSSDAVLSVFDFAITSPKPGQEVSNDFFGITGTAENNQGVGGVYYRENDGSWMIANSTNTWTNWTATVTNLNPGSNTISAYAVDASANFSPTNTVHFVYTPSAVLGLVTNGSGTVTPSDGGKLLAIGTNYTLKAAATGNNLFSNWVASGSETFVSNSPVLKFTMQSNLILTANFEPNPFLAEQGTFNGLFMDTNASDVTEAGAGFFTLTLRTNGTFTGKITLPGGPYSFSESFDVGGQAQFSIPAKPTPLSVNLQLNISDPASQQITGTVSNAVWTAGLAADRAVFSASTNPAVNYEGQYTLAVPGNANGVGSPGGFGWATLTISSAGSITMNGSLADGTAISQSSVSVSQDGRWPFYAPYNTHPTTNVGAVFGWMTFSSVPASTLGGDLYWFRPEWKTPAAYQSGFTNLRVPVIGFRFDLTNASALILNDGQAILEGGTLASHLTNGVSLTPKNVLQVGSGTDSLSLKLTTNGIGAGVITGGFAYPGTGTKTNTTISGVVLQAQNEAAGYFLRTNQSGSLLLQDAGMAFIPAGSFTMGDTLDRESDAIHTNVYVSGFYMDVNLVSYSQWQTVYSYAKSHGYGFDDAGAGKGANYPVEGVNWYDCVKWSNARSQQAELAPVYYTDAALTRIYTNGDYPTTVYANGTNRGYRLPTEAEWEKAARGGLIGERFPWGDTIAESQANYFAESGAAYDLGPYDGFNTNFDGGILWTDQSTFSGDNSSPVGSFAPNGYGLCDMAGNEWEWCWDWYATPYGQPTTNNPTGPAGPLTDRVLRGGNWLNSAYNARCAFRCNDHPNDTFVGVGFRCVRSFTIPVD